MPAGTSAAPSSGRRALDLAGLGPLLEVAAEAAGDHLVDRARRRPGPWPTALDDEPAVLALARQAVLEDDHRRDDVAALQVGDVEALDPQRRLVQAERVLRSPPARALRVVRSLARRVLCRASACCALRATVSIRARLSPRCGTRRSTLLTRAASVSHSCTRVGVRRAAPGPAPRGGRCRPSPVVAGRPAVQLLEEVLDEVAGGEVLDLVDDPAALAADPAAADVEDLHGRLELVLGERDDVGVGAVGEHDRLLLHRALERLDVVAQPGRPLVLLVWPRRPASPSRAGAGTSPVWPAMKSQKSSTISRCSSAVTRPTQGAEHLPM